MNLNYTHFDFIVRAGKLSAKVRPSSSVITGLEFEDAAIGNALQFDSFDEILEKADLWHGRALFCQLNVQWYPFAMMVYISRIMSDVVGVGGHPDPDGYRSDLVDDLIEVLLEKRYSSSEVVRFVFQEKQQFERLVGDFILFLTGGEAGVYLRDGESLSLSVVFGRWIGIEGSKCPS